MINITRAFFPQDTDEIVAIFTEYVRSIEADLSFQDYESEFATLPGKYADPEGCILLARREDELVGCVGYRRVDDHTCELKRLYVRPEARGCYAGRKLVQHAVDAARAAGYSRLCLDVLPELVRAQRLYRSLGFYDAAPVAFNPVPGSKFLALDLESRLLSS
jgi:putative acetyltransferase